MIMPPFRPSLVYRRNSASSTFWVCLMSHTRPSDTSNISRNDPKHSNIPHSTESLRPRTHRPVHHLRGLHPRIHTHQTPPGTPLVNPLRRPSNSSRPNPSRQNGLYLRLYRIRHYQLWRVDRDNHVYVHLASWSRLVFNLPDGIYRVYAGRGDESHSAGRVPGV